MPIPETQLETWANQGATVTSQATHISARAALGANESPIKDKIGSGEIEFYLQGSYRNDTNIRGDSDVDIVVELITTMGHNLSETEKRLLQLPPATYYYNQFREDVSTALRRYYGDRTLDATGSKSIKVLPAPGRLGADVVPCIHYKYYSGLRPLAQGITFWTNGENLQVVNFPKLHYANGCAKNARERTNGRYKATVRMFKNARSYMVDQNLIADRLVPSYFLECAVYNAAD